MVLLVLDLPAYILSMLYILLVVDIIRCQEL